MQKRFLRERVARFLVGDDLTESFLSEMINNRGMQVIPSLSYSDCIAENITHIS